MHCVFYLVAIYDFHRAVNDFARLRFTIEQIIMSVMMEYSNERYDGV